MLDHPHYPDGYEDEEDHLKMGVLVLCLALLAVVSPLILYIYSDQVVRLIQDHSILIAWVVVILSPVGIVYCIRNLFKLLL